MPSAHDVSEEHIRKVHRMDCYHGLRSRQDVEPQLREQGDFLIRMAKQRRHEVILSLCVVPEDKEHKVVHWPISYNRTTKVWELSLMNRKTPNASTASTGRTRTRNGSVMGTVEDADKCGTTRLDRKATGFESLDEMVKFYRRRQITSGVTLRNPIKRPRWLIQSASLRFNPVKDLLGQGNFCKVVKGRLRGRPDRIVAMKMLLENDDQHCASDLERDEGRDDIFREAQIMSKCRHGNVITFFGVACDFPPVMIVMEYCPGDSLLNHLMREKEAIADNERLLFSLETARGMRYLHHCSFVHRDLATRNCLISSAGIVKISDFGLARGPLNIEVPEGQMKHIPLRWMAPETISRTPVYSSKSDVWSFGVVLYEIFNQGVKPWPDEENHKKIADVIRHGSMPDLEKAPEGIRALMRKCWLREPGQRPEFREILKLLTQVQDSDARLAWPKPEECSTNRLPGVYREEMKLTKEEILGGASLIVITSDQITSPLRTSEDTTVSRESKESQERPRDMMGDDGQRGIRVRKKSIASRKQGK